MTAPTASEKAAPRDTGAWVMRLLLLALGIGVIVAGMSYGVRTPDGLVGPGMMPAAAGAVMVVAGAWESLKAYRTRRDVVDTADGAASDVEGSDVDRSEGEGSDGESAQLDVFGRTTAQRNRAVAVVFGVIALGVALTYAVGLLLGLSLMVAMLLTVVEKRPLWVGAVWGAGAFAFGYLVFGMALNVPLATGALGLI